MNKNVPAEAFGKCVMTAAPHTTLWDGVYALGAFLIMGIPLKYAIKKEFNYFLVGNLLAAAGALWIDRKSTSKDGARKSYIEIMAEVFEKHEAIALMIAPEGTRSLTKQWKTGFYHVAKEAGVPITLGYLDYKKKEAGVGPAIYPSDDMEADMHKIMEFYQGVTGKYPEKFQVDERYTQTK